MEVAVRRKSTLIRELTEKDFNQPLKKGCIMCLRQLSACPDVLKGKSKEVIYEEIISKDIQKICTKATAFGTTLWFIDKKEKSENVFDSLEFSGRATTCFKLLIYLTELISIKGNGFYDLDKESQKNINILLKDTLLKWNEIKDEAKTLKSKVI